EGHVAEEAEEVFQSYAFYRYQQEREERGAEVPPDPEIEQIQQDLASTSSQVGQRLAIIGDDICKRYDTEFHTMLESLQLTPENAYEHFTKIASSLFESGINWGRVIALLAFGYRMAMHVWQRGGCQSLEVRGTRRVSGVRFWGSGFGGWTDPTMSPLWQVAALDLDNVYMKYMLIAAVVVLGHLVVQRFF
ncbi:Bcl-2 homologous antagonist/killer, partial [Corvus brachyrhynchos]